MKFEMITALVLDCLAMISLAKMNVYVLLNNPVGVGDHPNIMETIQLQIDIISQNQKLVDDLKNKTFGNPYITSLSITGKILSHGKEDKVIVFNAVSESAPTAVAGGMYYSGSDDWYLGYEN